MARHLSAWLVLIALVALALPGCEKSSSAKTSGDAEPVVVKKSRFSGDTKGFVDTLMKLGVSDWAVADDGATILYDPVTFAEDGSFTATVSVLLGEEPLACTESGTWSLDGGKSRSTTLGNVNFEMSSTDCAGRTAPKSWRAELTVDGDDITAEMR
jgi:hypothetical protein